MYWRETIVGIFTLLGVLIGGYISYYIAINHAKRQEFNRAAAEFRSAFVDVLRFLDERFDDYVESTVKTSVYTEIKGAIEQHEFAAIRFRAYLDRSKRAGFDRALEQYCYPDYEVIPNSPLIEYQSEGAEEEPAKRKLVRDRINSLLSYAEVK